MGLLIIQAIHAEYKWSHVSMFFLSPSSTFATFAGELVKRPHHTSKKISKILL
jgi:hypothetical protein